MDVFETKIKLDINKDFEIIVEKLDLHYLSNKSNNKIKRSFSSNNEVKEYPSYQKLYNEAKENMSYREYDKAKEKFQKIVDHDKYNLEAVSNLGELYYRSGQFEKSLTIINNGLKIDTYHPSLNYIAGINYKALNDNLNSKESLGWAARSIKYRSNAYSQIADIYLREKQFNRAIEYAKKSLEFNIKNIPSLEIIAISNRYLKKNIEHKKTIQKLEELDPINHIISFEKYIIDPNEDKINDIVNSHRSELKHQTFLELAIRYFDRGLKEEAIKILSIGPQKMINNLWISYITDNTNKLESILNKNKIDFSFPFRTETIDVINWARNSYSNWKLDYLLAINLYGIGRYKESKSILSKIEEESLNPIFYLNRGVIFQKNGIDPLSDFNKAYQIDNKNWRVSKSLSNYFYTLGNYKKANKILEKSYQNDISNYIIGMDYVKSLVKLKKYSIAISTLKNLNILPYEHAGEGRELYSNAYIGLALENIKKSKFKSAIDVLYESKIWPENLGVGKPYNADERIGNYLIYFCLEKLNDQTSEKYLSDVINYSQMNIDKMDANHMLGYLSLKKIHGNEQSDEFLKKLIDKHGTDSEQLKFILNYKKDNNSEGEDNFYLLREILKLK
jgi:tetratricopeptide (TPR) repeat protein